MFKKIKGFFTGHPYPLAYEGRQFNCYVSFPFSGFCEVNFYEVVTKANGKQKDKFFPLGHKSFFIDDFDTVEDGVKKGLAICLADEQREQEQVKKIKNFSSSY